MTQVGHIIDVARDFAGLRIAARELLDAELFSADDAKIRHSAEHAANRDQVLAALKPRLTLADGYYERALYLFELDSQLISGITFTARDLDAREFQGVLAVRAARAEFEDAHPTCSRCGTAQNDRFAEACRKCGVSFRRKEPAA